MTASGGSDPTEWLGEMHHVFGRKPWPIAQPYRTAKIWLSIGPFTAHLEPFDMTDLFDQAAIRLDAPVLVV